MNCNHDVSEACCNVSAGLPMCHVHIIHMKTTGLILSICDHDMSEACCNVSAGLSVFLIWIE